MNFSIGRALGINELAGYTTCRFSRRDTCGYSSQVKQVDINSLFLGHIKGLLTLAVPDLMASGRLAIECKAMRLETLDDLSIAKTGKSSHVRR
jgi:hypothetical protein